MTRGIGDPAPVQEETQDDNDVTDIINELIKGQNKLHDRLVDLERKLDHMLADSEQPKPQADKWWHKGL